MRGGGPRFQVLLQCTHRMRQPQCHLDWCVPFVLFSPEKLLIIFFKVARLLTICTSFPLVRLSVTLLHLIGLWQIFGKPQNISIPASAYSSGKGSFQTRLPFPKGSQFLASMADATGFNAGGVSAALTVGASHGGSCNTTLTPDFFFDANSALVQCSCVGPSVVMFLTYHPSRPYTFTNYADAILPVTIFVGF
jgi:hypothetical protein